MGSSDTYCLLMLSIECDVESIRAAAPPPGGRALGSSTTGATVRHPSKPREKLPFVSKDGSDAGAMCCTALRRRVGATGGQAALLVTSLACCGCNGAAAAEIGLNELELDKLFDAHAQAGAPAQVPSVAE